MDETSAPPATLAPTSSSAFAAPVVAARLRPLRAVWRLVHCAAWIAQAIATCVLVLPRLDPEARRRRVQAASLDLLRRLGVRLEVRGTLAPGRALLVANHVSWLDIVALQAVHPVRFVSKAEVARWPLVGVLVRGSGTLLVDRSRRRDARRVVDAVADVLRSGERVALFPEGTTGVGRDVLPFHANLLEAALAANAAVQPVSLRYADAGSAFSAAAPFVGSTTLVASLWRIAAAEGLVAHVAFADALKPQGSDRRALATGARTRIQASLDAGPRG